MLYLSVNFADSWSFAVACNTLQPLQSLHFNLVDSAPDCSFNRVVFSLSMSVDNKIVWKTRNHFEKES